MDVDRRPYKYMMQDSFVASFSNSKRYEHWAFVLFDQTEKFNKKFINL